MTIRPPDMTRDEREAVAMILSLPDGPWDFVPGLTASAWAADMAFAAEMDRRLKQRPIAKVKTKRPGGAECKQV